MASCFSSINNLPSLPSGLQVPKPSSFFTSLILCNLFSKMKFPTSFYVLFALASGLGATAAEAEVGSLEVCVPHKLQGSGSSAHPSLLSVEARRLRWILWQT